MIRTTLFLLLIACNRPTADMQNVLKGDPRNAGVSVSVGCEEYLSCDNLIFDVQNVSGSRVDVSRVLFQFAETQKGQTYEKVSLSSKGVLKFYLTGAYFKQVGIDYPTENALYLLNHLPENVKNLDGSPAFQAWEGGWLGVATKQMDDLSPQTSYIPVNLRFA